MYAALNFGDGVEAAPLLIDTDCGIDDAKAILLAAAHPERAKIVAVTTVAGKYVCPSFLSVHLAVSGKCFSRLDPCGSFCRS